MRHLVTGATGLIGGHLVERLVQDGACVRALVRPNSHDAALRGLNVELITGDLLDLESVRRAVQGVTHVYHCGGLVSDWGARRDFRRVNVDGTRHIVEAALIECVQRFVHLSSAAVYGYPPTGVVRETEPFNSRRIPYIDSKIAAEGILRRAVAEGRLPVVVLRPVMVYGPRCRNYVGEIVRHLRRGSMILLDGGRHPAGLAYVENVVDACLLASRSAEAIGGAFNICDDSLVTWKEYVFALADGIGVGRPKWTAPTRIVLPLAACMETAARLVRLRRRPWLTRMAALELGQPQQYDISLARQRLGYAPRVSFETAIERTLDWVRTCL